VADVAETEQDRQIVVATDHLRLVCAELGDRRVEHTAGNAQLGLTLLTLTDVAGAGQALERRRRAEAPDAPVPPVSSDLDRLLAELRTLAERRYAGWVPTVGKNRTLTGVQFKPYSNGGGFSRPTPVPAPKPVPGSVPDGREARVRVGLLDTRLSPHRQLTGRYLADHDALVAPVPEGRRRLWWEGHATFIAGVVQQHAPTAVLDVGTALRPGVAPDSTGSTADEDWTMAVWDFAARLADYQDAGVSVINLSVGVAAADGKPPLVLERAIAQLTPSVVVVAAAGNHGTGRLTDAQRADGGLPPRGAALFPAALDNVLAVGALDGSAAAEFNPCGAGGTGTAPWIDVFAPGVDVVSTYLGDGGGEKVLIRDAAGEDLVDFAGWASWSGTSFAAGEITGAVAALLARGYGAPEAVAEVRKRYPRP
jgi:Subtilase family